MMTPLPYHNSYTEHLVMIAMTIAVLCLLLWDGKIALAQSAADPLAGQKLLTTDAPDKQPSPTSLRVDTDPSRSSCTIVSAAADSYLRGPDLAHEQVTADGSHTAARPWPVCTIRPGDRLNVAFQLVSAEGKPIRNRVVSLFLEGKKVRQVRTDEFGFATFPTRLDLPINTYLLQAVYKGSSALAAAEAVVLLVVAPIQVTIHVIPPLAGIRFTLNQREFVSDEKGIAQITVNSPGAYALELLTTAEDRGDYRIKFERWRAEIFDHKHIVDLPEAEPLEVGFMVSYPVYETFTDIDNNPVDPDRILSFSYLSSHGALITLDKHEPHWVEANRVMRRRYGLEKVPIQYSLMSVMVDGTNVVNRKQQRFFAESPNAHWPISLIFYSAKFSPQDALFGSRIGSGIELEYPDGNIVFHPADKQGTVALTGLARGEYKVQAVGARGMAPVTPVAITRFQDVPLLVISWLDMGIGLSLGLLLAFTLLFVGRPQLLWLLHPRTLVTSGRTALLQSTHLHLLKIIMLGGITLLLFSGCQAAPATATVDPTQQALARYRDATARPPVLAYYYIWFDPTSWDRAKGDYPLLGRYSSYDRSVMRQHIRWAKAAGIDGFIVSWKSSDKLNERLASLAEIAVQEAFKLALLYQGLDFAREPISTEKIASDLDYFVATYAHHPAFALFKQPLVIWGGTWAYSREEIAAVIAPVHAALLILASERNIDGYTRLIGLVDGDAYYWGAVNPDTYPNYPGKLIEMGAFIHTHNGLWIAPAAPGFDARLVGGKRVVERADGAMFKRQLAGAIQSTPDAVGIISWNEFSENSHIEPSEAYGMRYLQIMGEVGGMDPGQLDAGSWASERRSPVSLAYGLPAALIMTTIFAASLLFLVQRRQRAAVQSTEMSKS